MKTLRLLATLALSAATAAGAGAQDHPTTPVTLAGHGSTVSGNVYVGPYAAVLGSGPGAPTVDVYCVDYLHESTVGDSWVAAITSLHDGADLSATRFGSLEHALENYRKAAWLSTMFAVQPTAVWGDIHATMWSLFTAEAPHPSDDHFLAMANDFYAAHTTGFDWGQYFVLSDVSHGDALHPDGNQEFVTAAAVLHPDVTVTPEPISMTLVATGLAGIAATRRRKQRGGDAPLA